MIVRQSTASCYLTRDVVERPNLHIAVGLTVAEIFFDQSGQVPKAIVSTDIFRPVPSTRSRGLKRLKGITFAKSKDSALYRAVATREIIVCGGAINTPALLQLSGIGPSSLLSSLSIPLIADLPVGENLGDHLSYAMTYKMKSGSSLQYLLNQLKALPSLLKWMFTSSGPLTSNVRSLIPALHDVNEGNTCSPKAPLHRLAKLSPSFAATILT